MTIQDTINSNAAPSGVPQRIQMLNDQGFGFIDPQAQLAMAQSPMADQQMIQSAGAYQNVFQGLANAPVTALHAVTHFFDDPVLQKQPSTGLALQQYFLQRQGWSPIAQGDVTKIQRQLNAGGYLAKSDINGVWTPQSMQAFQNATSDHINKQVHEGGGFSITHALSALLPTHWIPALIGAAVALPDEVRSLFGDVTGTLGAAVTPSTYTGGAGQNFAANSSYFQSDIVGAHYETPERISSEGLNAHLVSDINAILSLIPIAKGVGAGATAFRDAAAAGLAKQAGDQAIHDAAGTRMFQGLFTDLGKEAAQRGPGVLSRSMMASDGTGLLNTRLFSQTPIMRQLAAPVRALYDPEGKWVGGYYAFRTGIAQPYRNAGIQALGSAGQQAMLAGAAERGIAAGTSKLDKHNELADQIYSRGTIQGPWGTALDMLSGALHGPLETSATRLAALQGRHVLVGMNPSHTVGALVDGVAQNLDAAQRPTNVGWALSAGTHAMGARVTVEGLVAKYGHMFTQQFLNTKLMQFAAAEYADSILTPELAASGVSRGSQEAMDRFQQLTHQAWNDPQIMSEWRGKLLSRMDGLAVRFAQDANNIKREARDAYRQGIDNYATAWAPTAELFGNHTAELVTPLTTKALGAAQQEHAFAASMARPKTFPPLNKAPQGIGSLAPYVDTLHHESDVTNALPLLPGAPSGHDLGAAEYWMANDEALALGQGDNKGIHLTFDARGLNGHLSRNKPAWEFNYGQGRGEFRTKFNTQADYQRAVTSVRIDPSVKTTAVQSRHLTEVTAKLRQAGWDYEKAPDGTVTLTRPPAPDVSAPALTQSWLAQHNPALEPGSYGLARKATAGQTDQFETQTTALANAKADELAARLKAAGSQVVNAEDVGRVPEYDAAATAQVKKDAIDYLLHYGGLNPNELDGADAAGLINMIRAKADRMPKEITLPEGASPRAKELWQQISDAGFKPVVGTDIGHLFAAPVIDPLLIEGYNSKWRALANASGLGTIPISVKNAGMMRRLLVERTWQDAINKGHLRVPASINAARLHEFLLDNLAGRTELHGGEGIMFKAARRLHMAQAQEIAGPNATPEDITNAMRQIETQIARGSQPLEVSRKEWVAALTRPMSEVLKTAGGHTADVPFMDENSAKLAYDLYVKAQVHEPAWMFGAGKIEDVFRAGFGFLGTNASQKVPVLRTIARMPNEAIKARNRYRFQLDPMFSMRRVVKSALKGSLEGAPFTIRPFDHMVKAGTLHDDLDTLNRVMPMAGAEGFDNMDRLLSEQDAAGIYNPRHHMALLAGELSRQGMKDTEIRAKLERAFTYGDRTAFERTLGTIFYPFSFEKTLWRNVGSYMLDHPGARLLTGAAMQGYGALSQHDHIDKWLEAHGPMLKEFQKLNAFDHGIGPGAIGGINAMYAPAVWNLFGPQKLGAMKEPGLNTLMQVFPALREANSLLLGENVYTGTHKGGGNLVQQAGIGLWGLEHAVNAATSLVHAGTPGQAVFNQVNRVLPARSETFKAAQNDAYAYRNSLILALAPVLDFNYHNRGNERVWSATANNLPASVRGQTINRGTIDEIVHAAYPDFDPSAAQSTAVAKKTEVQRYLADLQNSRPHDAPAYQQFYDAAKKVQPAIQRGIEDPKNYARLAKVQQDFRTYAINMAEQDPAFLAFYNRFFLSQFGPIEGLS